MNGFKTLDELYKRVTPALKSKCKELNRIGINKVKEHDIWNYLKNNVWNKKINLSLAEIVSDIMNLSNTEIEKYVISIGK